MRIACSPVERATVIQAGNRGTTWQSEPKIGREERYMRIRVTCLFVVASLILAFAFIAVSPAAPNKASVPAPAATRELPASPAAAPAERHPEIREALGALRKAKEH